MYDFRVQTNNGRTKMYPCELCDKSFKCSTGLKEHVATIHTKEYRYYCEYCDRGFYLDSRKRTHIKRSHDRVPPIRDYAKFQCPKCGKCLANKQSYDLHLNVVHNRVDRFYCDQCGKGFPLLGYLVQHQKVNHFEVDVKPFSCPHPDCTKTFRTKDMCRTHQLVHDTDRKFECFECSKVYIHLLSFKKHLREHKTGKKVFKCELCDKMVTSSTSLRDHFRTHTGEKPFQCPHCEKTFVNKKHLKIHSVVHTKEKKYECRICGKKYTQRSTLRGHFLKNHPEDDL